MATSTTTIGVAGMTCDHCVKAVTEQLSKLDGVVAVQVDLPTGRVTLETDGPVGDADIHGAVDEAGYELTP